MDKTVHILLAEDSLEGILSAVSYAYRSRYGHANNKILIEGEEGTLELFSEYISVPADPEESKKVYSAIRSKLGPLFLEHIEYCALSGFEDRGEVIYRSLILGFANGPKVLEYVSDGHISRLQKIFKNVQGESHHWLEFLRFKVHDLSEGFMEAASSPTDGDNSPAPAKDYLSAEGYISTASKQFLTSVIEPRHRVVSLLTPHYADRFPSENIIIYDKVHDEAAVSPAGKHWYIMRDISHSYPQLLQIIGSDSADNASMEDLWKIFYDTTFIPERENRTLQRSLLPLRFRGDMSEHQNT